MHYVWPLTFSNMVGYGVPGVAVWPLIVYHTWVKWENARRRYKLLLATLHIRVNKDMMTMTKKKVGLEVKIPSQFHFICLLYTYAPKVSTLALRILHMTERSCFLVLAWLLKVSYHFWLLKLPIPINGPRGVRGDAVAVLRRMFSWSSVVCSSIDQAIVISTVIIIFYGIYSTESLLRIGCQNIISKCISLHEF